MRPSHYIVFSTLLFITACGKKDKSPGNNEPETPVITTPVEEFKCEDIPPPTPPFEWQDSTGDGNKNINAFLFDPVDPDNIIMVVNGDAFGSNKLLFYHIPTKTTRQLGFLGKHLPQVNSKGWITYSDSQNNVYLIKDNRDSVIALTTDMHAFNPHWDYTGNAIYYFKEGYFNVPPKMLKVDLEGKYLLEFEEELPYFTAFRKTNRFLSIAVNSNYCDLIMTDFDNQSNNRVLLSGPAYSKPGQINFDNLTLDKTDENFYWSNSNGIFRCNLATLKVDTLFKNCENSIYTNPIISFADNELTYAHHTITPVTIFTLYHRYLAMELNIATGRSSEIRIFP